MSSSRQIGKVLTDSINEKTVGNGISFNNVGIQNFVLATKGAVMTSNDGTHLSSLSVGGDYSSLVADSAQTNGLRWRTADYSNVKDYGAVGDGSHDDTTAINNALAATPDRIYFPVGTYKVTTVIVMPANKILFGDYAGSILKSFTAQASVLLDMSNAYCGLVNMTLDGNAAGAGGALYIGGGSYQFVQDCIIQNFRDSSGYLTHSNFICGIFGVDAGHHCRFVNCYFISPTTAHSLNILPGGTESQGSRSLVNCSFRDPTGSGISNDGSLNINSTLDTLIVGCNIGGLSSGSSDVGMRALSNRIGYPSGAANFNGNNSVICGNHFTANVTVNGSRSSFVGNSFDSGISLTDSSTSTGSDLNYYDYLEDTLAGLTWNGNTTNPSLGNGTLTRGLRREGKNVTIYISLVIGSTTTFGSGDWYFQLPSPWTTFMPKFNSCGTARIQDNSVPTWYSGTSFMTASTSKIYVYSSANSGSGINATTPQTWAVNDTLDLTISYYIL